ncbi:MAG: RNA polymerase subunit sigma [Verrucomicrobiales bacterium]|nr:RNA polymerase subunit sigma [Verrucomicrobiales bacterium]
MSEADPIAEVAAVADPQSADELLPLVYEELRRLAAARMAREGSNHTLQPTALVHEAWIRLSGENHPWSNRRHFFAAASEAMRRILVDRARRRMRVRNGGGLERAAVESLDLAVDTEDENVVRVAELLDRLALHDSTGVELIKLRFFAGCSNIEAAKILGLSERTAKRNWAYARAWLYEEMRKSV